MLRWVENTGSSMVEWVVRGEQRVEEGGVVICIAPVGMSDN